MIYIPFNCWNVLTWKCYWLKSLGYWITIQICCSLILHTPNPTLLSLLKYQHHVLSYGLYKYVDYRKCSRGLRKPHVYSTSTTLGIIIRLNSIDLTYICITCVLKHPFVSRDSYSSCDVKTKKKTTHESRLRFSSLSYCVQSLLSCVLLDFLFFFVSFCFSSPKCILTVQVCKHNLTSDCVYVLFVCLFITLFYTVYEIDLYTQRNSLLTVKTNSILLYSFKNGFYGSNSKWND